MLNRIAIPALILGATFASASENPHFIEKMKDPAAYSLDNWTTGEIGVESICSVDDLQHIESYDNRYQHLGYDYNYVQTLGASVGAMKTYASDTKTSYCSGTLIGADEFLTASHCVDSATVGEVVSFGYQLDEATDSLRVSQQIFTITEVIEDGADFGLDYAVLRLAGTPGNRIGNFPGASGVALGWKEVDGTLPNDVLIIQHPLGQAKQVDAGSNITYSNNRIRYSDLDTQGGSSGSGVLNAQGKLVGVHTNGGCTTSGTGSNSGAFMGDILAVSNVITNSTQVVWPNGNAAVASSAQDGYPAVNVGDNDLSTRWSAQNVGETITFDLGETYNLAAIDIAFLKGDSRATYFDLAISTDGETFTTISTDLESSGSSTDLETFELSGTAKYVRIIGQGNSSNDWNSITEVEITGSTASTDELRAPENLTTAVTGVGELTFTWDDVNTSETGYLVEYARYWTEDDDLQDFVSVTLEADATSYVATGLTEDRWYYVRVSALSDTASSDYAIVEWTELDFIKDLLSVSAEDLSFDADSSTQSVNISSNVKWAVSTDASWLNVDITSGENDGSFASTAQQNTSTESRTATITVIGSSDDWDSTTNRVEIVVTQAGTAGTIDLLAPANLTTAVTGAGEITFTWDDVNSSETGYLVEYARYWPEDDDLQDFVSVTVGADTTSYVATGLTEDRWYYVRVSALSETSTSDYAIVEWTELDFEADNITLSTSSLSFGAESSSQTVTVDSNIDWWTTYDASWVTKNTSYLVNDSYATFTVEENTSTEARSTTVTFVGNPTSGSQILRTLTITQAGAAISGGDPVELDISYAYASSDDGNVVANTLDGDVSTRWSANGDGEFVTYDLGSVKSLSSVKVAFFKGDSRNTYFSIAVSENGTDFITFLANETSSGNSTSLEEFFISTQARYVRIIGHGNSSNTWNSLTEVEVHGNEL